MAYIIYTFGSTGNPKGVLIPHKGPVNHVLAGLVQFSLKSTDVVIQQASFSFDASVEVTFDASGLPLILPLNIRDIDNIVELIIKHKITYLYGTSSKIQIILQQLIANGNNSLQIVIVAGEMLSETLIEEFNTNFPAAQLWNLYGPTETSITITDWKCKQKTNISIGKPNANTKTYILDKSLQMIPIGVVGDLYFTGIQLARGYLNKPKKTKDLIIWN